MTCRAKTSATAEKPSVYNMRPEGCQETARAASPRRDSPQPTDFKPFWPSIRLTLSKSGTYTHRMTNRRLLVAALSLAACALAWPGTLVAQAIQRAMYVSVLDDAGAPVPDLGPADFIVREDNVAREVLKVAPADRADADRRARRHQPGARATTSRTSARRCRRSSTALTDRRGARTRSRSSPSASGRPSSPTTPPTTPS